MHVLDNARVVGHAHGRHHVLHGVLELAAGLCGEFGCGEEGAQHGRNVAVGFLEGPRHAPDQSGWRVIPDEVDGELAGNEARAGLLVHQQIHRLGDLGESAFPELLAQQLLGTEVMARRVELERSFTHVVVPQLRPQFGRLEPGDTHTGQDPGKFLDVML